MRALYINCTLKRSPERSHTQGLVDRSRVIMDRHGVETDLIRAIDHDIATGVWPDMTEHGWDSDEWPALFQRVLAADVLVLAGPIWLGDNSSVTKKVIERLYACSSLPNDTGQYAYYGRVGGCLVSGNEDGVKHCAMNGLYRLQHLGYTIPPQGGRRLDRGGRARTVLPRRRIGRPGQRLHQPQHHLHDLEPHAPRDSNHEPAVQVSGVQRSAAMSVGAGQTQDRCFLMMAQGRDWALMFRGKRRPNGRLIMAVSTRRWAPARPRRRPT
jgi:multimeric flavodoxin WrbA